MLGEMKQYIVLTSLFLMHFFRSSAIASPSPQCYVQVQCTASQISDEMVSSQMFPEGQISSFTLTKADGTKCLKACQLKNLKPKTESLQSHSSSSASLLGSTLSALIFRKVRVIKLQWLVIHTGFKEFQ